MVFERIIDFDFSAITLERLNLDKIMVSPPVYEYGLVKAIEHGGIHPVYGPMEYLNEVRRNPVKVEGVERFNEVLFTTSINLGRRFSHFGPVSCHLFLSCKGAISFPSHTDTEDVIIYMVSGQKVFEGVAESQLVREGESIYIPRGVEHRAVNIDDSVMLSFGLERYLEDKL